MHIGISEIQGNYIGTNATGTAPIPNRLSGILLEDTQGVMIGGPVPGTANRIAFNGGAGIFVDSGASTSVRGNSIYSNGKLGIELNGVPHPLGDGITANDAGDGDAGPNTLQNFPVLTSASVGAGTTRVAGTINSTANTTFQIDVYANQSCDPSGYGEGETYLGTVSVTTDAGGNANFAAVNLPAVAMGNVITATTTDPNGSTSEFSMCKVVTAAGGVTVTPTNGLVTTEAGGTATFTVQLNSVPSASVTIPVSSSDTTEGAVSPASLTFQPNATALNPQTVTVTGKNDVDDGDIAYTIVLGAATSADAVFSGQNPPDVSATNRDDDDSSTVTCSPRPPVTVSTAANGDGRLRVTVAATTAPSGVQNRLSQLQFEAGTNANVQIPGQATRTGPFAYDIPNQPTSFTFYVGREHAGPTYLPFTVVDGCSSQPWKTFVGGGASAF
jgi:hypothetical protein